MSNEQAGHLLETMVDTDEVFALDLGGYGARSAAKYLIANWQDALADGAKDNLIANIDDVIAELRNFQDRAREVLPATNGGFAGLPREVWVQRLAEIDVEVYQAEGLPNFGFTGCEADDFETEDTALSAAVRRHFGSH